MPCDPQAFILERVAEEHCGHETPCWVWQRHTNEKGYGRVCRDTATYIGFGERRAHRIAYIAFKAPIPDGMTIDHLCTVKGCCNPDHLEPVPAVENFHRWCDARGYVRGGNPEKTSKAKNPGVGTGKYPRQLLPHCGKGHEFTPENTRICSDGRRCRECLRIKNRRRRARKRRLAELSRGVVAEQASRLATEAQVISHHDARGITA